MKGLGETSILYLRGGDVHVVRRQRGRWCLRWTCCLVTVSSVLPGDVRMEADLRRPATAPAGTAG
jgi:hypothetical protein